MKRILGQILGLGLLVPLALEPACKGNEEDPAELAKRIDAQLKSADEFVVNGRNANAQQIYESVLAIDANRAQAVRGLGRIALEESRFGDAVRLLNKASTLDPKDAETFAALGKAHEKQENFSAAVTAFGKAYGLKPSEGRYGLSLGSNQRMAKQLDAAEKTLRQVIADDERVRYVYSELGDVLRAQNKLDEALRTYMKAQSTYASDKAARAGAAFIYESKGEVSLAIDEWSEYIRMDCCSSYSKSVAKPRVAKLRALEGEGQGQPAEVAKK